MNKDLNKKKAEFLKSIMKHPKLSRVFTEALSSPIGSTKRTNSKSILSIMKKMNGMRNDGQGGPGMVYSQPTSSSKQPKDYSNMIIFPAAPKFKTKVKTETKKADGQGGLSDIFSGFSNPFSSKPSALTSPSFQNPFTSESTYNPMSNFTSAVGYGAKKVLDPISKALGTGYKAVGDIGYQVGVGARSFADPTFKPSTAYPSLSSTVAPPSALRTQAIQELSSLGYANQSEEEIRGMMQELALKPKTQPSTPKVTPPSTAGAGTGAGTGAISSVGGAQTGTTYTGGTPVTSVPQTKEEEIKTLAQSAVDQGTGAAFFAQSIADEKFSGGLGKYLDELDVRIKKDFKVDEIERSLSDITSMKANFVPTIENYIRGKDEYLKAVDGMITSAEDQMFKTDMSDPEVRARAEKHLAYLYTLKGRQNQRYGSLLNNAVADYNADLDRMQGQYNNVYKQYNDTITRKATIAQNEYNTLYSTMSDLYNNLENAPVRQIQMELMKEQLLNAHLVNIQNGTKSQSINFWPEQKEYKDQILDDKGNLLSSSILNLPTIYSQASNAGKNLSGVTDLVARGMATGLTNAKSEGGEAEAFNLIKDYRNMINSLAKQPWGSQYANQLAPTLARASDTLVSSYVLGNVSNVKQALNNLVSGGWIGKSYLEKNDKEGWIKSNSNLDRTILGDIYDAVKMTQNQSEVYSKNPEKIFTLMPDANGNTIDAKKVSNVPDEIIGGRISNILSKMWGAEPSIVSASSLK